MLLNGTGNMFYVKDKQLITESFGAQSLNFHFYNNDYSGNGDVVDYKDWINGLSRRNNSLKLYYCISHYGFKRLRDAIDGQPEKCEMLIELVKAHPNLFRLHTTQYGVITFECLDHNGAPSNELTKAVNAKISNIKEGFSSPGEFQGLNVVRIVVGHFHTTEEHIRAYFEAIFKVTRELQEAEAINE
jgi:glutamate/tyrosine decarboxylase-like PLP-dependent enzyme